MRRLPSNLFIFPARNSKRERRPRCVVQHLRYSNQFGTVCCVLCLGCVGKLHLFFDGRIKRAIWYFPPGSIWHESLAIDRERWEEWFDFSVDGANSKWEFVSPPKKNKQEENKKCGVDVLVSFRRVAPRYLLEVTMATAQLHTHTHTHRRKA